MEILHYTNEIKDQIDKVYKTNCSGKDYTIDHPDTLVLNTIYVGKDSKVPHNSQGWERDNSKYFRELLNEHPEYFNETNKTLILNGKSPIVNNKFISYFPQYSAYKRQKLILHHIGGDGQVVVIPQDIHYGFGEIHNIEKNIGIRDVALKFSNNVELQVDNGKYKAGQRVEYYKVSLEVNKKNRTDESNNNFVNKVQEEKKNQPSVNECSKLNTKDKPDHGVLSIVSKAIEFSEKHPIVTGIIANTVYTAVDVLLSQAVDKVFNEPKKSNNVDIKSNVNDSLNSKNVVSSLTDDESCCSKNRTLMHEVVVGPHKERYHTKNGVVWHDKDSYTKGGKDCE